MSEHTPGPWSWERSDDDSISEIVGGDGSLVVTLVVDGSPYGDPDYWQADARLIAAAPRLLDVLENVLAHARKHTDGTARLNAAWLDDVRAAITEAKGD